MYSEGIAIDAMTVFSELEKDGKLRRVGGAPYLHTLLEAPSTTANVGYYANIVAEKWKLRKLDELGQRLQQLGNDETALEDIPEVMDAARQFLDGVDDTQEELSLGFRDLYDVWTAEQDDDRPSFLTPYLQLNDMLNGGLQRQRLYVVGARPGCGKTIMLTQMAVYAALSHQKCLFFSLELGKADLMGRILACGSHADYAEITRKNMSAENYAKVQRWAGASANLELDVDDTPGLTIEEIAQRARIHKQRKGLDLVFIDYLQLVSASKGGDSRVQQVDHIAVRARAIARQLDCAVIVAAQLNRNIETQQGRPRLPTKADFRESGGIEQTADAAFILSRPPDDNGEEAPQLPLMNLSIVKNRTGTEGIIQLAERFDQARFDNAV